MSAHIADILYHRSTSSGRSTRPIAAICADMPAVVQAHLDRCGVAAIAETGEQPHICRVRYRHEGPEPLVSIIVPTKNQPAMLKRCIETVLKITQYENYEIIVVDNGSDRQRGLRLSPDYRGQVRRDRQPHPACCAIPAPFNFSAMNNRAVREEARGEYLCLLNNDAAPLDGDWLGEMMALARRPDVGAVGAKLLYPDGHIQHGGVILGVGWGTPADHPYIGEPGEIARLLGPPARVAGSFGGYRRLPGDPPLDLRGGRRARRGQFRRRLQRRRLLPQAAAAGHLVVWTPYARLLHEASASQRAQCREGAAAEARTPASRAKDSRCSSAGCRKSPSIRPITAICPSMGLGFAVETEGRADLGPGFPAAPSACWSIPPTAKAAANTASSRRAGRCCSPAWLHSYETMRLMTPPEIARMAPDSIVLQRQLEWHQIAFIEQLKQLERRVSRLRDRRPDHQPAAEERASQAIAHDIGERLNKAVALCDRLVVSTEPLARTYGKLCDEVVVLPNRLERGRWAGLTPKRRPDGKPRVGWAGAVGHAGDLAVIASAVEATAKEVDWVFFGMCPDALRPLRRRVPRLGAAARLCRRSSPRSISISPSRRSNITPSTRPRATCVCSNTACSDIRFCAPTSCPIRAACR